MSLDTGFFAPEQFPWQQIGTGIPQQGFFDSIPIFHLPRHIENIFHDPVIGKWDTGFQRRVHAGAVHAVEQGLHEPFDIQIANVTTAGFLRGFAIQMRNVGRVFPHSVHENILPDPACEARHRKEWRYVQQDRQTTENHPGS